MLLQKVIWKTNTGLFSNLGYKLNKNQILSLYLRLIITIPQIKTYKINFSQQFRKINLNGSHSTGLKSL